MSKLLQTWIIIEKKKMNIHLKEIKLNLNPCEVYEAFRYEIDTIILDSSKEDEKLSKYSFIGLNPYMTFSSFQNDSYIDGVKVEGTPFKILEELLTRNKVVEKTNIPLSKINLFHQLNDLLL